MQENFYLIFSLQAHLYGINTAYVEEIFSLPELRTVPETLPDIIGCVNLRGNIIPVMDLSLRLSSQFQEYHLTDSVVVLRWRELPLGIVVSQVHEVKEISPEIIQTYLSTEQDLLIEQQNIIAGIVQMSREIFILNHPDHWFTNTDIQQLLSLIFLKEDDVFPINKQSSFSPNLTVEEREILRQRADNLKLAVKNQDLTNLLTVAIFTLNNHLFGINIEMVREFTNIYPITPVPCCPTHIIGNMNLRGEIVTLVDLRGILNLPITRRTNNLKAVIVDVEGIVAGILVEEVNDAMFSFSLQDMTSASPHINYSLNSQYFQGTTLYKGEKVIHILNLEKMVFQGGLIVDEVV